jgi:hypothetical protein
MQGSASGSAPKCHGSPTLTTNKDKVRNADLLGARYVNVEEGQHLAELARIAKAGRHPALHQELNYQRNLQEIPDIKLERRQVGVVLQSLRSVEGYSTQISTMLMYTDIDRKFSKFFVMDHG